MCGACGVPGASPRTADLAAYSAEITRRLVEAAGLGALWEDSGQDVARDPPEPAV